MADPEYKRGLNECFNSYPTEQGSWTRRPSFRQLGYTRLGGPARLLSLSGLTKNYYNIELSSGHLRVLQGANFITDGSQPVTNISSAKPCVVTTAAPHGWATGDQVLFTVASGPTDQLTLQLMMDRVFQIEVLSTTTFALHSILAGGSFDATTITWSNAMSVAVQHVCDVATPYADPLWQAVKRVQADTGVLLLHPAVAPQFLTFTNLGMDQWSNVQINPASFMDGPYLDPVDGTNITPTGTEGIITIAFGYQAYNSSAAYDVGDYVTASSIAYKSLITANVGNTPSTTPTAWLPVTNLDFLPQKTLAATDLGRHIRLFSEPPLWATSTSYTDGNVVTFQSSEFTGNTYWMCILAHTSAAGSKQPGAGVVYASASATPQIYWVPYPQGARWTWGKITSTAGGTSITAAGNAQIGNASYLSKMFDGTHGPSEPNSSGPSTIYAGLNIGAGTGASICSGALVWPGWYNTTPTFAEYVSHGSGYNDSAQHITINLRAKQTLPGSSSDGTLLGTTGAFVNEVTAAPIPVQSSDLATTWNYIWVEIVTTSQYAQSRGVQFFSTGMGGGSALMQVIGDPLLYSGTVINTWQLGLFNDTDPVYPTAGCFYGGRAWLAVGNNRFVASSPNDIFDMHPTNPDGSVDGGCGINYSFNSEISAPIQWMHPTDAGIVLGLAGGERLLYSTNANEAITADNAIVELKTSYGSSDIEPQTTPLTVLFVHANGRDVHEYMRDAFSGRFVIPPLTDNAKSLTYPSVVQLAYQRAITPVCWAITSDGTLIGTTYERIFLPFRSESPPKYNGWHHHEHGDMRAFTSISVGPSVTGSTVETLVAITYDSENNNYRIEMAGDLMPENNDIFDCDFLDSARIPYSSGVMVGSSTATSVTIAGLTDYQGHRQVGVFLAGLYCGTYLVSGGQITIPVGDGIVAGGLLTDRWLTQVSAMQRDWGINTLVLDGGSRSLPCVLGFPYVSQGQLLRPVAAQDTGAQAGPGFGKKKRNHGMAVQVVSISPSSFEIGTDFNRMVPLGASNPGEVALTPTELFSGIWYDVPDAENDYDGMLAWQCTGPYSARVCAVGGFIETEDR